MSAVDNGFEAVVYQLLKAGANVNLKNEVNE